MWAGSTCDMPKQRPWSESMAVAAVPLDGLEGPLFSLGQADVAYQPRRVAGFWPDTIVLARGSRSDSARERLAEQICRVYPGARRVSAPDVPHNRVPVLGETPVQQHYSGKRTLVLGEHRSAVRQSDERDNTCPNYWHFSPQGFCPYDCKYCYLAGTQGVRFSPTVRIFLNLPEMLSRIDRIATALARETAFYLGKLQDGLALDPLTGYSRQMVPFFAAHPFARLIILTKSADAANLLGLRHRGRTILSWSLNPPAVCDRFEAGTPGPAERIDAMERCAAVGYPIRAVIMPIIPIPGWREAYGCFLRDLLARVPLERITLGGICSYDWARRLMEAKLGPDNAISRSLADAPQRSADGRRRYPASLRTRAYRHLVNVIRRRRPDLQIGLCLEESTTFEALRMTATIGHCNCVL